jgi:hypothetical protein
MPISSDMNCMIYQGSHQPIAGLPAIPGSATEVQKHSRLGLTSFGISIAVGLLMAVVFVLSSVLSASSHRQGHIGYPGQTLVGFAIIFLLFADLPAVGLGIAAVMQPRRNRLFGILGLIFSSATILGTIGLIIIGLFYISKLAHG